ncbi:hypothetical protein ACUXK4_001904 [Methylorubrum extorquens]
MKFPKKKTDDEPSFRLKVGWTGFETSASGTIGIITSAVLAILAGVVIVVLNLPFLR